MPYFCWAFEFWALWAGVSSPVSMGNKLWLNLIWGACPVTACNCGKICLWLLDLYACECGGLRLVANSQRSLCDAWHGEISKKNLVSFVQGCKAIWVWGKVWKTKDWLKSRVLTKSIVSFYIFKISKFPKHSTKTSTTLLVKLNSLHLKIFLSCNMISLKKYNSKLINSNSQFNFLFTASNVCTI